MAGRVRAGRESVDVVACVTDGPERTVTESAGNVGGVAFAGVSAWRAVPAKLGVGVGSAGAAGAEF